MAMGGAGVASARSYNATIFNPALLVSSQSSDDWKFYFRPYLGARLLDRDNFLDALDEYQDSNSEDEFDRLLEIAKRDFAAGLITADDLRALAAAAEDWQGDIDKLSDKPLRASLSYGFTIGSTAKRRAWGAHYRRYFVLGARVNFAEVDRIRVSQAIETTELLADISDQTEEISALEEALGLDELGDLIEQAVIDGVPSEELLSYYDLPSVQELVERSIETGRLVQEVADYFQLEDLEAELRDPGSVDNPPELKNYLRYQIPENFESTIEVQGAYVDEVSVGYAFTPDDRDRLKLGLNIKHLTVTTVDFEQSVEDIDLDNAENSRNQTRHQTLNLDVGVLYQLDDQWALGAVVKNLIPHDFKTVRGNDLEFRPLARAGVSYRYTPKLRFAADLDLTRNDPLGFDPDKQYLSLGAEWYLWRSTAIRGGLRYNMATGKYLPSIGFGLGTFSSHLDIAVTKSADNDEVGLSLQAGFRF
ncbi:hypothetical protein GCM10027567_10790 [Spongiibacter taiwanensis]